MTLQEKLRADAQATEKHRKQIYESKDAICDALLGIKAAGDPDMAIDEALKTIESITCMVKGLLSNR